MPLPKPNSSENRAEFISRCMSDESLQREFDDPDQRLAVCTNTWDQSRERSMNDQLLKAIQARQQKQTQFSRGILTADRYVKTLEENIGSDLCYRYAAKGQTSFDDVLQKASRTLVYSNDDMVVEGIPDLCSRELKGTKLRGVDLPKNTLMAFRHVLTTSRKDRDGDILRSEGAEVDPKMLLLWQHVHTLPIGKMVKVLQQNKKRLTMISAIVDINELSHDAAVMIDNDMGRFSHGFKAIEFEEIREGKDSEPSGFDVKQFEIMEESLVSVPANPDAETNEVLLSLVEGGKLTSPMMKEYGLTIRRGRPVSVPGITINYAEGMDGWVGKFSCTSLEDLKAAADAGLIGVKENENKSRVGKDEREDDSSDGTSKETDGTGEDKTKKPSGKEVKTNKITEELETTEKAGRSLSKANEGRIRSAQDAVNEVIEMEGVPRAARALLREASGDIGSVLSALSDDGEAGHVEIDVKQAMSIVFTDTTPEQKKTIVETLQAIQKSFEHYRRVKQYSELRK